MTPEVRSCVEVLREFGATDIYLFGSRARGEAGPDSDYDFAVRGVARDQLYRLIGELLVRTRLEVDVVPLDDGSDFARHIEQKIQRGWAKHVG